MKDLTTYLVFHPSISPLSEGNHLHLDLVDSFVEFFLVLPLLSPKVFVALVGFDGEGFDHF